MEIATIFGTIAATLTTISFIPQVVKIIMTRNTKGISLLMYSVFVLGVLMWLVYGILLKEVPMIIANTITFVLAGIVLILKIFYK